ncbi:MAG: DUF4157 domain-containing protein [Rhodocyclaceae bacterium]|nr:DUF4157 domain-containing protein [Rhodocyclaceae bacterium]
MKRHLVRLRGAGRGATLPHPRFARAGQQRLLTAFARPALAATPGLTTGPPPGDGIASRIRAARGPGRPLPRSELAFFGPRLGRDLSAVRLHTDARAATLAAGLGAQAFTLDRDVFFARDRYRPGTREGRHLLAHELAHVTQPDAPGTLRRKIDLVTADAKKRRIDFFLSLGIYGDRASDALAGKWQRAIQHHWSGKLKMRDGDFKVRMHARVKAYRDLPEQFDNPASCPKLPGMQLAHAAIEESNAVLVAPPGCSSVVDYRCDFGFDAFSCGRWGENAQGIAVAHETGHLMGLIDRYTNDAAGASQDDPGYWHDIMANVWNDNGKTDFSRAWVAAIYHYFTGQRY